MLAPPPPPPISECACVKIREVLGWNFSRVAAECQSEPPGWQFGTSQSVSAISHPQYQLVDRSFVSHGSIHRYPLRLSYFLHKVHAPLSFELNTTHTLRPDKSSVLVKYLSAWWFIQGMSLSIADQHQLAAKSLGQETLLVSLITLATIVFSIQWNLGIRDTQRTVKNCPEL